MITNCLTKHNTKELIESLLKDYQSGEYRKDYSLFITNIVNIYKVIVSESNGSINNSILGIVNRLETRKHKVSPIDNIFLQDLLRFFHTEQNITFNKYMILGPSSKKVPISLKHYPLTTVYGKFYSELEHIFSKGGLETSLLIAKFLFKVLTDD